MPNSIVFVEFADHLKLEGHSVGQGIIESWRVRLPPILMTSLATIIGLSPMAVKFGEEGSPTLRSTAQKKLNAAVDGIVESGAVERT